MTTEQIYATSPITYRHDPDYKPGRGIDSETTRYAVRRIRKIVSRKYGVTISEMDSVSRKFDVVLARQVCVYLIRTSTKVTLKDIGVLFGNHHYTTILHAYRKIQRMVKDIEWFRAEIVQLKRAI